MEPETLHMDRISDLPSSLKQTILTLMPIRDAFRTAILSRNWRHCCVDLPKLAFDNKTMQAPTNNQLTTMVSTPSTKIMRKNLRKFFHAIYTVLLLHNGPVLEFSLSISQLTSCCEIDQIILYLARRTSIEKFNLSIGPGCWHKLPSSFFSLQKLNHINLENCAVELPLTSLRFESLRSLCLCNVRISKKGLISLISCSSVLKSLTLIDDYRYLKAEGDYFDVVQLFHLLPLIEDLEMNYWPVKCFAIGVIPQSLPNRLVHLRALKLYGLSFGKEDELRFILLLVKSSPNLKKIKLQMSYNLTEAPSQTALNHFDLQDYSYVKLDHLCEFKITNFSYTKPGMDFLKLILSKAPMLKKAWVVISNQVYVDDEVKMLRDLLWNPCASAGVQIKFVRA